MKNNRTILFTMKRLLAFLLFASICPQLTAQQSFTPVHDTQIKVIDSISPVKQIESEMILHENNEIWEHLQGLKTEVEIYREDVRQKTTELNDNMSHWLVLLTAILTLIGAIFGIVVPVLINRGHERRFEDSLLELKAKLATVSDQANKAEGAAKLSEELKNDITTLKEDVSKEFAAAEKAAILAESLKDQVAGIERKIAKDSKAAESAAKKAKASQLLSEALSENDSSKKIDLYTEAIRLNPSFSEAYNNRGITKNDLGDIAGAYEDFNKAIENNPKNSNAHNNRGNLKKNLGDRKGAMMDYDKAIELAPNYSSAYYNRGNLKKSIGDIKGAMMDYDKSIELNSKNSSVYNNRGILKKDLGNKEEALMDYDKAIELNPNNSSAFYNRGAIKKDLGDIEGALIDFSRAIDLDSSKLYYYRSRARLYRSMAETEKDEIKKNELIEKAEADELKASSNS